MQAAAAAARAQVLSENFRGIIKRIEVAKEKAGRSQQDVRLVAVSKRMPASDIKALYEETGHRHYGENYVQELLKKAATLPKEIEWHLIGALQTNKCRDVARLIPNLWAVESVDTKEKAQKLELGRKLLRSSNQEAEKLRVYVQVNTSGEESKSGCDPKDAVKIAECIIRECENLTLHGLMTIGSFEESTAEEENKDFKKLVGVKEEVENRLRECGFELQKELELSMGMSEDFEEAINQGADNVRVGTAIFGERPR
ncbi:hypothetical protein BZA77DRAFT_180830 [Pyronema omphalodes]|nr:hypothetical protein BZA77DRAFT_180830 [Pyronema omphalodes]